MKSVRFMIPSEVDAFHVTTDPMQQLRINYWIWRLEGEIWDARSLMNLHASRTFRIQR